MLPPPSERSLASLQLVQPSLLTSNCVWSKFVRPMALRPSRLFAVAALGPRARAGPPSPRIVSAKFQDVGMVHRLKIRQTSNPRSSKFGERCWPTNSPTSKLETKQIIFLHLQITASQQLSLILSDIFEYRGIIQKIANFTRSMRKASD